MLLNVLVSAEKPKIPLIRCQSSSLAPPHSDHFKWKMMQHCRQGLSLKALQNLLFDQ